MKADRVITAAVTISVLLISVSLMLLTGCRLYDREIYRKIPVPEIKPDTIIIGPWNPDTDSVLMMPEPQKIPSTDHDAK